MSGIVVRVGQKESYVGGKVQSRRGVVIVKCPMKHGQIYSFLIDGKFMSATEV